MDSRRAGQAAAGPDMTNAAEEATPIIQPDFKVIRFDHTEYWDEKIVARTKGGKLWSVYLFDKNQNTYCCELTPSYCLYFIECYAEMCNGEQSPDDLDEEVRNEPDESVIYMHCGSVDRLPEDLFRSVKLDEPYDPA